MALRRRKSKALPLPPLGPLENLCPLDLCMTLLGGAWTPNIVWCLTGEPRRFSELRADIPRVSAKVLTARLRALEETGVLTRHVVPTSPPSVEYALTDLGRELIPVIEAIDRVGSKLKRSAAPAQGRRARSRS
jgi:DNA-binding HxlR family transcriptional regulator